MEIKFKGSNAATAPYLLDVGDGEFCASEMPMAVAEEIARKADAVEMAGESARDGFEVKVDDMLFPKGLFDIADGANKASGRTSKKA